MSSETAISRAAQGVSAGSEATVLRLHDAAAPAIKALSHGEIAREDSATLDRLRELLGRFLDRSAAERYERYAVTHAGYRWKPRLALVLPEEFSTERPTHLRDLTAALEVLAPLMDQYNVNVVSDSPDAALLFRGVVPYSHEAIAASQGAIVIGSRRLNALVGAIRPSRRVGADPCAFRVNKRRIVFEAGGVELPFARTPDCEIARNARGCVSVLLDEDDEVPSFLEALGRLRAAGLPLRLTLSSRADEDFARRIHAAFETDPRVEIHDPEPRGLASLAEFQISNDLIALLTQPKSTLTRYFFHQGEFWRVGEIPPHRSDFYLFRGEESNAHRLLASWFGERGLKRPLPATLNNARAVEPLVSIVVPIYDRAVEIIRLAHSIYQQDYPWIEVVFVANGSPPETIQAIRTAENYLMKRRFRVRIIELVQACGTATFPRDLGIRASSGDLVCVLDSDDWLDPGFFAFLRGAFWRSDTLYYPKRLYHDHGRAMGESFPFGQTISGLGTLESRELAAALQGVGNFMSNSGVCFARDLFERAGGIDHRLIYGEDFYLWWRCALAGGRAQELDGRVNISLHRGNNELLVGEKSRLETASGLARSQELTQWL
jgi:hypothetical protein